MSLVSSHSTMKVSATFLCSIAAWTLVVLMLVNEYRNSKPVESKQAVVVSPESSRIQIPKEFESKPVDTVKPLEEVAPKPVGRLFESPKKVVEPIVADNKVTASMPFQRHVPSVSNGKKLTAESYHVGKRSGVTWKEFLSFPRSVPSTYLNISTANVQLNICGRDVVDKITAPGLSDEDFEWCKWTLSDSGGKVKVGKSYGTLNGKDREKYEQLNCNSVLTGKNPSCDDSWGDNQLISWKKNEIPEVCGDSTTYTSKMHCFDSSSLARFCVFENAMFDFSKMHDVARPGRSTGSRKWDKGFLATDCDKKNSEINFYEFYSPSVDRENARCNYVINETVLAYSHDNIYNLGHSMSDFMNVWAMLWLSGTGEYARDITFLNIDALRMGHSYKDEMNQFARHYELQFARILKAADFARNKGTVCFKRLVFQSRPVILFTWDGWWQDMRCSFVGPSSLFQRWNLQIRNNYGLLKPEMMPTNDKITILLITRSIGKHSEGQETRVFRNTPALSSMLEQIEGVELVVQDLATLGFEEQIKLIASSSLLIGMHGAGIASSMHMAVGSKYCCGVIEIFPQGEFKPIRGYGNMARRMGHHYERLELSSKESHGDGGEVPVEKLKDLTLALLERIKGKPTCMLPSVIEDPHFSSVPSAWGP